ncbi:hypothetical protein GIB67_000910 [Kingdonia uniflora]|uniref:RRM domain-containing protein n=1 Tax=Kingdonia uniflora TaxID=39325 RepID=A0A7J7MFN9_9MAGN|nr:hypothetical protein GIB67_000910 [Kingdonia uniflora]
MGDPYWRYVDPRQQVLLPAMTLPAKRPRSEYDIPAGHELLGYLPQDNGRARPTETIEASYERYLRNGQIPSYVGVEPGRALPGGILGHPVDDQRRMSIGGLDPGVMGTGRSMGFGGGRPEIALPSDASNTVYVEGLPANCTRREVSHIFRPFVGFKEVRLVNKESRNSGGEPLVLCFVDFDTPAQAATAMDALRGYKFDEHERDSSTLRLQFSRHPGPRSSGGGSRGGGSRTGGSGGGGSRGSELGGIRRGVTTGQVLGVFSFR